MGPIQQLSTQSPLPLLRSEKTSQAYSSMEASVCGNQRKRLFVITRTPARCRSIPHPPNAQLKDASQPTQRRSTKKIKRSHENVRGNSGKKKLTAAGSDMTDVSRHATGSLHGIEWKSFKSQVHGQTFAWPLPRAAPGIAAAIRDHSKPREFLENASTTEGHRGF